MANYATVFVVDTPIDAARKTNVASPNRTSSPSLSATGPTMRTPPRNVPFTRRYETSPSSRPTLWNASTARVRCSFVCVAM